LQMVSPNGAVRTQSRISEGTKSEVQT